MFNIAICDDDKYFCMREKRLIVTYMESKQCAYQIDTFQLGEDLLCSKRNISEYDIIFLDIKMDKLDGIETAKRIREVSKDTYIVFVTAFIEYCMEGYKVDAIRYLLKDDGCFDKAFYECLDAIMEKRKHKGYKQIFQFQEEKRELYLNDIIYIDSNLHKLTFHLAKGTRREYTMYERLDVMDELLQYASFCRIHKSYLVNLEYLEKVERYNATICGGINLPISKSRYLNARNEWISYRGAL